MKKNFTLFVALFVFAILKAQTPKVYYPFDGQSLNSTFGAYPLSTVNGSASFTTATHNGNGTHALTLDGSKYESTEFKNLTQQFTKINFVAWNLKSINDYALLSE